MTWFSPMLLATDFHNGARRALKGDAPDMRAARGLGSAQASGQWAWAATPVHAPADAQAEAAAARLASAREGACLRAPVELLSKMSEAARALGRTESDVWVEAAREWLRRREGESGTPPVAPALVAGSPTAPRRIPRGWDEIDALLIALRAPVAPQDEREGAPAA